MCNEYNMPKTAQSTSSLERLLFNLLLGFIFFICASTSFAAKIVKLSIKGPIGPATADYIVRSIDKAQDSDLILIRVDTPGGLNESMRIIIQKFLSSKVPIITYVSPVGARAASAGTYIVYASTLAVMAPGTQLGAASPVTLDKIFDSSEASTKKSDIMQKKMTNDAVATIRTLAQLRGRDLNFAQNAVLNGAALTSTEALKAKVINFIATDDKDLLKKINGVVVEQNNQRIALNTSNPEITEINPDWRTYFLSIITDPTAAYLLLLLGIYGIFFELVNPGYVLPGVVGTISMVVALYALQLLPVSYAGFTLIILGIGFIASEAFLPSFGSLGVGGTIAFILGSIMLFNTQSEAYQIGWSVILAMAVVNIVILVVILGALAKSNRQKVLHGLGVLIGARGRALGDINPLGQAIIRGEIWNVEAPYFIASNKPIIVVRASGLTLYVEEGNVNQGE